MSVRSAEIIDQLPALRRYAGALVGDQAWADGLVELCLERLLADQMRLSGRRLRHTLFALFDLIHDEMIVPDDRPPASGTHDALATALRALPLEERKALLLVTIAGFEPRDAAAILRVPTAVVAARVLAARERLRRVLSHKVLVIEDEPVTAISIAHIVTRMGHEVCGVAHSRQEALARVRETPPTLILADVRLRDGDNGIATVREITRQRQVPVIFVTGHAHDLVVNPQLQPALVVGKPFAPRTLEAAVRRALGTNSPP